MQSTSRKNLRCTAMGHLQPLQTSLPENSSPTCDRWPERMDGNLSTDISQRPDITGGEGFVLCREDHGDIPDFHISPMAGSSDAP